MSANVSDTTRERVRPGAYTLTGGNMPLKEYFKGHGAKVMSSMKKKYGDRAEHIFYATANAKGMKPAEPKKKRFYSRRGD